MAEPSTSDKGAEPPAPPGGSPELKGWLFKWTNYIKGYQKRWFVLTNGLLSYYRTQGEMAYASRGTISVHGASIQIEDSSRFVQIASTDLTQKPTRFVYSLNNNLLKHKCPCSISTCRR